MKTIAAKLLLAVTAFAVASCGNPLRGFDEAFENGASIVQLETKEPGSIAGTYRDLDIEYSFALTRTEDRVQFELTAANGANVLNAIWTEAEIELNVYDDASVISLIVLETLGVPDETHAVLQRYMSSTEYRSLPKLSRSLAMLGVMGNRYPASLPLHQMALLAETIHGPITVRPDDGDDRVAYMYANPYASQPVNIAIDDFDLVDDILGCNELAGPFVPPEVAEAISDACVLGPCSLEEDPNNDECFGMCGKGCDCWKWLCGDCCSQSACVAHDALTRDCEDGGFSGTEILSCPAGWLTGAAILGDELLHGGFFSCGDFGLPFL